MQFYLPLFALALVSAAAPLSTDQSAGLELQFDDALVVLSNGETYVMKQSEVEAFEADLNGQSAENVSDPVGLNVTVEDLEATKSNNLVRRGGAGNMRLIVPMSNQDFLNWDVAMSPIIQTKGSQALLAIASGKSITNGFTAGGSSTLSLVPDFLEVTGSYERTKTTTATVTGAITFTIPANRYGVIVSQPRTFRKRGYTWNGRPGSSSAEYWQFDSYNDASFDLNGGTLRWVQGIITTCTSTTYPIRFCMGNGFHR